MLPAGKKPKTHALWKEAHPYPIDQILKNYAHIIAKNNYTAPQRGCKKEKKNEKWDGFTA